MGYEVPFLPLSLVFLPLPLWMPQHGSKLGLLENTGAGMGGDPQVPLTLSLLTLIGSNYTSCQWVV